MSPSANYVQLDLNSPEFQQSWLELEADDAERVRAALKKILKRTWQDVYKDKGLHWEKIQSIQPPTDVDALYTFRLSKSARAVGYRHRNYLRVLLVTPDHDGAHGKK